VRRHRRSQTLLSDIGHGSAEHAHQAKHLAGDAGLAVQVGGQHAPAEGALRRAAARF